jgi:hypothetical protein
VLLVDPVGAGRAGWRPREREPIIRGAEEIWELFRTGPAGSYAVESSDRRPYPRRPVPGHGLRRVPAAGRPGQPRRPGAASGWYGALLERVGPAVVLSHSAAGPYAERAALAAPGRVRAHVAVEPSGAPDPDEADLRRLREVPHLFLWGDHLDGSMWQDEYASARRFHDALLRAGGRSDWIDLPEHGRPDNSHLLMMDTDSAAVAALVAEWIAAATGTNPRCTGLRPGGEADPNPGGAQRRPSRRCPCPGSGRGVVGLLASDRRWSVVIGFG